MQTRGSTEICNGWYKQRRGWPACTESGLSSTDNLIIFLSVSVESGFSNNIKLFNNSTNERNVIYMLESSSVTYPSVDSFPSLASEEDSTIFTPKADTAAIFF